MLYISAILISFLIIFLNISIFPHIWIYLTVPTLMVSFLAVYSLRDRTIFPYFLSFFIGLIYDSASTNNIPIFTITFIGIVIVGKLIFSNLTNYGLERTSYFLVVLAELSLAALSFETISASYQSLALYLILGLNMSMNLLLVFFWYRFGATYLDFVEKTTAERFR